MKVAVGSALAFALAGTASAFSPPNHPAERVRQGILSRCGDSSDVGGDSFGAIGVGAILLGIGLNICGPSAATAYVPPVPPVQQPAIYSTSVHTSETIKTMDFSLPSSYDSISDVKSSATSELVQEENTKEILVMKTQTQLQDLRKMVRVEIFDI